MELVYHDRDGNEVPFERWIELCEDETYFRVGSDYIGDVHVSTVWVMGSGIRFGTNVRPDPAPFETMVFDAEGKDLLSQRYPNRAEAINGHAAVVGVLRELGDALKEALPEDIGDV